MANEEQLIDDQFQLAMCIASGSSSQVWEVIEKSSARHLAMKLLKNDVPEFRENKAQMKRESEIHKLLEHPNIIKFERYSSNRDNTYILMEYFRASNLKLQIKADSNSVHLRIRQLLEGVCSALAHVHHKGFIHRDIKPDNVLMNKVGEVRLCDFSLSSKQVTGIGKMFAGRMKNIQGTRTYIAPETIRRRQPTIQTDMYSLGVMFFEVLALRTPFQAPTPEELLQKHLRAEAPNPSEFNPNVTPEMDRIVSRLLKKKPADRPGSVDEILQELKRIRIFKEDVVDAIALKKANEDKDALEMLSEIRLDSRADAKLKEMLATNPEFAQKFAAEKQIKESAKKAAKDKQNERIKAAETVDAARLNSSKKTAAPAPAAPPLQPPMMMPMQMPGYPPGYPQFPPGYPGYPQGQMPMMPPQMMPGFTVPAAGPQQLPQQIPAGYSIPANPTAQSGAPPASPAQPPKSGSAPTAKVEQPAKPVTSSAVPTRPPVAPAAPQTPQRPQTAAPVAPKPTVQGPAPANKPAPAPAAAKNPPPASKPPAASKPLSSPAARPFPIQTPPSAATADMEFMTDLPDVL